METKKKGRGLKKKYKENWLYWPVVDTEERSRINYRAKQTKKHDTRRLRKKTNTSNKNKTKDMVKARTQKEQKKQILCGASEETTKMGKEN